MRLSKILPFLALPLVLAACGGEEETVDSAVVVTDTAAVAPAPVAATPTDTGMAHGAGAPMTVQLSPLNNSGISGEATLTAQGQETQVSVRLTGLTASDAHPGHIHQGTCENLGSVVVPLPSVTPGADGTGTATGTAAVDMSTAMSGQHVVNYHLPDGTPASCGPIQAHQM